MDVGTLILKTFTRTLMPSCWKHFNRRWYTDVENVKMDVDTLTPETLKWE